MNYLNVLAVAIAFGAPLAFILASEIKDARRNRRRQQIQLGLDIERYHHLYTEGRCTSCRERQTALLEDCGS